MNRFSVIIALLLTVIASGCRKSNTIVGPPPPSSTVGVYVVNEGGFSGGGALAYYDADLDSMFQSVAGPAQSWVFPNDMKIVGSRGYVTVNGSDRIDIINVDDHAVTGSIIFPQFTGPGYLAVNGSAMYVANYNGSVSVIDLSHDSVVTTIPSVVGFPGGIAFVNGRVFVSDMGLFPAAGTLVKVVDPSSGAVVDSVTVQNTPGGMTVANGRVFVACVGTGKVYRIHPTSLAVEDSVQLPAVSGDIVSSGDTLFVLGFSSIAKLYGNPLTISDTTLIDMVGGMYFYSLSVDESMNELYVSNIVSPGGSGQVEIYTTSGILRRPPMPSGIFPGAFAFKL